MTPVQWQEMLTAVATAVTMYMAGFAAQQPLQYQQPFAAVPPTQVHKSGTMTGRHIRLGNFQGTLSAWSDWSWQFKNVIISQNSTTAVLMSEAETTQDDIDED